uniref:Metalloendopeptidase n=1 Tax=Anopheles maculatus TaxID=74869 RepID=A0A182SD66_9DIPT
MTFKPLNYLVQLAIGLCLVQLSLGLDLSRYTKPSKEVGIRVKSYDPKKTPGYAHELGFGHYYQGDILLRTSKGGRLAVTHPLKFDLWVNGIVPYVIRANFTAAETQTLEDAFAQYAAKTCIRFVPRTDELQYITITNRPEGCYSYVGRSPDPMQNQLNLQTPGCMRQVGTPVHEMMHTLGFLHEQSRPDRDDYIEIFTENLAPEYQNPEFIEVNFGRYDGPDGTVYGLPYNYGSVMHYSRLAGAASIASPVLTNKQPFFGDFGSEAGLTDLDVQQLNARYCSE